MEENCSDAQLLLRRCEQLQKNVLQLGEAPLPQQRAERCCPKLCGESAYRPRKEDERKRRQRVRRHFWSGCVRGMRSAWSKNAAKKLKKRRLRF